VVAIIISAIILGRIFSLPSISSWGLFLFRFLRIGSHLLLLFKVVRHSILFSELLPRTLRQLCDRIPCQPHLCHCIQHNFIGDGIRHPQYFPVDSCFESVDVLSLPQPAAAIGVPMYISRDRARQQVSCYRTSMSTLFNLHLRSRVFLFTYSFDILICSFLSTATLTPRYFTEEEHLIPLISSSSFSPVSISDFLLFNLRFH
jgi:hypothetical protein